MREVTAFILSIQRRGILRELAAVSFSCGFWVIEGLTYAVSVYFCTYAHTYIFSLARFHVYYHDWRRSSITMLAARLMKFQVMITILISRVTVGKMRIGGLSKF